MKKGNKNGRWMMMVIGLSFIICQLSFSSASAQMKPDQRYAFACGHETYQDLPMIKVTKGWAARPIKVKNLPQKGKDFIISEYLMNEEDTTLEHVYTWDGQKHVYGYDRKVKH
ncbi:MAG: hypothetical protein IJP46_11015 [Prevotella sp.]|nr:hypothetical protein [Prevotella sp.]